MAIHSDAILCDQIELDENIVSAAKSTMAYSLARQESNVGAAVSISGDAA